jgi:spermidine synthase
MHRSVVPVLYTLFFISGGTGLVYEQVWARQLTFVFGGTTYAVTTVLVAFMGGLGLGSYIGGRISRSLSQPGQAYGVLEIAIGLYALVVPTLLSVAEPIYRAAYPHVMDTGWLLTAMRFAISGMVLLIPTTCMGATLPLLVRFCAERGGEFGGKVATLYGTNTLGAVFGTVATGFLLIPGLGLSTTTTSAAAVNLAIGAVALLALRSSSGRTMRAALASMARGAADPASHTGPPAALALPPAQRRLVLVVFAISGFAAMVYQIAWTRALVMSLGSSTYSFTCILAAFILGLALGSFAVTRLVDRWERPILVFGVIQLLIGGVVVLIAPIYGWIPHLVHRLVVGIGSAYGLLLALEFILVIAVTFVPTFLMGAAFPLVTRLCAAGHADAAAATGRAYAINTLGTISGSFLAGFVLIRSDVLGVQNSIIAASLLNALSGAVLIHSTLAPSERTVRRRGAVLAGVALVPLIGIGAGRWDPILLAAGAYLPTARVGDLREKSELVFLAEGVDLTVAVMRSRDDPDQMSLRVNGKPDASTLPTDMSTQLLLGHLPALLAPEARDVCLIGLGSGISLGALALHEQFERLDCVEISAEVVRGAEYFEPFNRGVLQGDPRVRLIHADGRNHLALTDRDYDLIISQPSNPWIAGVSNLFTREFFGLCGRRLRPGGVACVWLQGYMMSADNFRMIVRTLTEVFPFVSVWETSDADYLFIVSRVPPAVPLERVLERLHDPRIRADLYRGANGQPARVLARFLAAGEPLRAWASAAPVHTDDNALLEFSAPRFVYRGEARSIARRLNEIQASLFDGTVIARDGDPAHEAFRKRLADAQKARRLFEEAQTSGSDGDAPALLRLLVDAYRLDPGRLDVYVALIETAAAIVRQQGAIPGSPRLVSLIEEVNTSPEPTLAPPRARTLADVAAHNLARADRDFRAQRWKRAAAYLAEARELDPRNARVQILSAAVLVHLDRSEEALWLMREAVADGHVDPQQLYDEELLVPVRGDPRFSALFRAAREPAPGGAP